MTKLGSRKLHIFPKVTKMGSITGHRIDYNRAGALRGQQHIPSKNLPKYPPGAPLLDLPLVSLSVGLWHQETEAVRVTGCTYRKDEPAIIRSKLINDSV